MSKHNQPPSEGKGVAACSICGKPIDDLSDAWRDFRALARIKTGEVAPESIMYTGKLAHDACIDKRDYVPFDLPEKAT